MKPGSDEAIQAVARLNAAVRQASNAEAFEEFLGELVRQIDAELIDIEVSNTRQFLRNLLDRFSSRKAIGRLAFGDAPASEIRDVALAIAGATSDY